MWFLLVRPSRVETAALFAGVKAKPPPAGPGGQPWPSLCAAASGKMAEPEERRFNLKDLAENRVHALVCSGAMSLHDGQALFAECNAVAARLLHSLRNDDFHTM
jgi:hypothetical protein